MSKYSRYAGNKQYGAIKNNNKCGKKCNENDLESTTPPLPFLKIQEVTKASSKLQNYDKKSLHKNYNRSSTIKLASKSVCSKIVQLPKHINTYNSSPTELDRQRCKTPSACEDDNGLLSVEHENTIIEQNRKKRKLLIEKLTSSINTNNESRNKSVNSPVESTDIKKPKEARANNVSDMFSENEFNFDNVFETNSLKENNTVDDLDDDDGYYKIRIGETLQNNRYTIKNMLGKGVFANVVLATDKYRNNDEVAIKIIRNNTLMYNTGLNEEITLKEIIFHDPKDNCHCIRFLRSFKHREHLCMVLEPQHIDLRTYLKKNGKQNGLSMKTVISYSKQLFLALNLLKKIGIIHADIKPDNILLDETKNIIKLCDFGSAVKAGNNEPTPYLVSRFYRAPEIILGLIYDYGVDVWSTACTIYEIATGKIMFTGNSNNKMLKYFMDLKGKIPNKLIKRARFKDQHFNYKFNFLLHKKDEVTGREKYVELNNITAARSLHSELKNCFADEHIVKDSKIDQLKDLLERMTMLDPKQRILITECIAHSFVK